MMKQTAFAALLMGASLLTFPAAAQQVGEWEVTVGGGVAYLPEYEGSDNFEYDPIPVVEVDYKDSFYFANIRDGIGTMPFQGGKLQSRRICRLRLRTGGKRRPRESGRAWRC